MKAIMLMTAGGTLLILTSHKSVTEPALLENLKAKGIEKFVAWEVPLELAKERYGTHFSVVEHDLHETDDLRILDIDGSRAFKLFNFEEMGEPVMFEAA